MPSLRRPDGCRLYYERHGPEYASHLLLLEGMGGDIAGWRRNIRHLAARYRVIAFDFRGNGRSDKPDEPMTMDTFVEDTIALLDHLAVRAAHVYGQSFGGMVAQQLAIAHRGRVRSLVLGCTSPGPVSAVKRDPTSKVPKGKPYLALYSERFARENPGHVADDLRVARRSAQPAHARRRQWEAIQELDFMPRLSSIACPTLIIHGTEDRTIPVANAHLLAERIRGADLALLEGAGHVYHSERADEADELVLAFLDRVESPGAHASDPART